MSTASVASMAIGGILGDLIGIRLVYLAAGIVVLGAAVVAMVMFRGLSGRPVESVGAAIGEAALNLAFDLPGWQLTAREATKSGARCP